MAARMGRLAAMVVVLAATGPAAAGEVKGIVVTSDKSVNCSNIKSMVADVTRGCTGDREKALAIFNFVVRMMWIPYDYDQPKEGPRLASVTDPVKNLVNYGAGGCGIQQVIFATLLKEAGVEERGLSPGFAHVSNEVKWDGKWHWVDTWLPLYLMDEKGEIYSYDELMANRDLVRQAVAAGRMPANGMYNPQDINALLRAKGHRAGGSAARKVVYSENLILRPGEQVKWLWDSLEKWYWPGERFRHPGFKFAADRKAKQAFPYWEPYARQMNSGIPYHPATHYRYTGNAVFTTAPPLSRAGLEAIGAALENVRFVDGGVAAEKPGAARIEIGFDLPYILADSEVSGAAEVAGAADANAVQLSYSLDGGASWLPAEPVSVTGSGRFGPISLGRPNSKEFPAGTTSGQYKYLLRVTLKAPRDAKAVTLKELSVVNTTMLNFYSRPWLEVGANHVAVTTAGDGADVAKAPLEVTWRWLEDWKDEKTFTQKVDSSQARAVIGVGGTKRPKMVSITIACPAR